VGAADDIRAGLDAVWASDFVQANPKKSYKGYYPSEYDLVAAFLAGGPAPDSGGFSKLGRGLCEIELARRSLEPPPPPPPPPANATLVAKASYEGFASVNAVPLWTNHVQQKEPGRMTIVDDPLGQRGKVMRVEVRPGDTNVAGSGTWERAQVYASNAMVPLVDGAIIARSLYIMVPASTPNGRYAPYCGDHHSGTTGGGNFRLHFGNGNLSLSYFWGDAAHAQRFDTTLASPLSRGVWHHIVAAHRYSADPTKGWAIVALDGVEKVNRAMGNLYIGQSAYHKEGWYRDAELFTHVHYSDTTSFWTAGTVEEAYAAALAA
jgi:polysaccharide lyase-like protein